MFSSIMQEICIQIKNKVHYVNQLIEVDLMMYNVHSYDFF